MWLIRKDLDDDKFAILDLENVVLTGSITERQRDGETRLKRTAPVAMFLAPAWL